MIVGTVGMNNTAHSVALMQKHQHNFVLELLKSCERGQSGWEVVGAWCLQHGQTVVKKQTYVPTAVFV